MINEWKYCYDDAILEYAYDDGRHYDIKYWISVINKKIVIDYL
jgi:hypothetical protein